MQVCLDKRENLPPRVAASHLSYRWPARRSCTPGHTWRACKGSCSCTRCCWPRRGTARYSLGMLHLGGREKRVTKTLRHFIRVSGGNYFRVSNPQRPVQLPRGCLLLQYPSHLQPPRPFPHVWRAGSASSAPLTMPCGASVKRTSQPSTSSTGSPEFAVYH